MTASASAPAQRSGVIAPYGGTLVDLMAAEADRAAVKATATKTIECSDRNACDVELLCVGGFSPLRGFMHQEDYDAVVSGHRLAAGQLFGLPIVMDTDRDDVVVGDKLLLTYKGQDLAVLEVEDKWEPNKVAEAKGCYGTTSIEHPAVRMITMERKRFYLGGSLQGLALPERVFPCKTPAEVRAGLPRARTWWRSSAVTPFTALITSCSPVPSMHRTSVKTLWCSFIPPVVPLSRTTSLVPFASRPMNVWRSK